MALRKIIKMPDEILRKICKPVEKIDDRIRTLLDDMADTMYENDGAGLAAPQVGIVKRVVVVDVGDENGLIELINPVILSTEGEQLNDEGCLSVSDTRGYVKRPQKLTVEALDRYGKKQVYHPQGYLAVAFCHEIDHLNGIIFTDKMEKSSQ